ncbi:MAG: Rrf2 family transcriptional regulator [Candidatus Brocadiae bacterium]|nr:Rrf2 family transcriptional regulator [Candidatus Brocadiia bacterium]
MLSQTAIYALRAIGYIAAQKNTHLVLAKVISEEMKIPKNFLSKILHKLAQKGFIESIRGTNGGFRLGKPAKEISLAQIVEIFMNIAPFQSCFLGIHSCQSCGITKKWDTISKQIMELLEGSTVDQIFPDIETKKKNAKQSNKKCKE